MLGYALFTMLYGADRISELASVDLGQVLFVFTIYKVLLDLQENNKPSLSKIAIEMVSSPIIIAIGIGIIIGATGLYSALIPSGVSGIFDTCTDFVSAPTSAIILITIGYDLAPAEIPWKKTLGAVVARIAVMLICRVLAEVIVRALGIKLNLTDALNILFILPPPFVLAVFAKDENEQAYISSSLSFSTVATILGFIVLAIIG
jgi:predicted permease